MVAPWLPILAMAMMVTTFAATGTAEEKSASVRLHVPAGVWTGTRLQGLPGGGSLRIEVTTDGPISVRLLDEEDYQAFPEGDRALFRGDARQRLGFEVTLPTSGDYYIIADNRDGISEREVVVAMVARSRQLSASPELGEQLQVLARRVDQVFDLGGLELRLEVCGRSEIITRDSHVTVCTEYVELLIHELGDRSLARDALLYTVLYELGRKLNPPQGSATSATADSTDMAAALMILFNQTDAARNQARHFAAFRAPETPLGRLIAAPDHPLNPAVARKLLDRLEDPDALVMGLQDLLLPRMRTEVLEALHERPPQWAERERIKDELARRRSI